ncbi:MAG: FHA domain-containing protein [Gammaproteobacteria bacterium]|jgi:pSer/pThr/pTyr-binding forkhead associated (FHA) protein
MALLALIKDNVAIAKFPLEQGTFRIGRLPENDLQIDDELVSAHHAVIEMQRAPEGQGGYIYHIRDEDSTNSTFVNGAPISRAKLNHNDLIRIGLHSFKFFDDGTPEFEKTRRLKKSWIPGVFYTR